MEKNPSLLDIPKPIHLVQKGRRKYHGMKNHLGLNNKHNKFKNSSRPKTPKGGCYVCKEIGQFVRDCRHNKSKTRQIVFMLMTA